METQVVLVKVAFGRYRMLAQIGDTVLKHVLLFPPEYEARARVQADRIDRSPERWRGLRERNGDRLPARTILPGTAHLGRRRR